MSYRPYAEDEVHRESYEGHTSEWDSVYASLRTVHNVVVTEPWKGTNRQGQHSPVRISRLCDHCGVQYKAGKARRMMYCTARCRVAARRLRLKDSPLLRQKGR